MKKSYQKQVGELQERSDVDPHGKFDPDELGMDDWGDGFHVQAEPVLIERGPGGQIVRTTPLSEAHAQGKLLRLHEQAAENAVEAPQRQRTPGTRKSQEKMIDLLAGLMMTYYSRYGPNQLPYNPLYDGIPLHESKANPLVLQPGKTSATLVHVPAHEVHDWLKQVFAKRADLVNARTGRKGWTGDINDLVVTLKR